jgi:hypothetical protein
MKKLLTIAMSMVFATAAVRADLANYQSVVSGQSPTYYNTFDNTLVPTTGSGTFTAATAGAGFGSDLFGNANHAASFTANSDYLTGPASIISGAGTTGTVGTPVVGTLSLLFRTGDSLPNTGYFFSDSETVATSAAGSQAARSAFALQFNGGAISFDLGDKKNALSGVSMVIDSWYYFAVTYSFDGTSAGDTATWYLGAAGGSLSSGSLTVTSGLSIVGDGSTFVVGNKQATVVGIPATSTAGAGAHPAIDELATWNTGLTSGQIQSQFGAVQPAPEPSTYALLGIGGLLVLFARRKKLSGI